MSRKIAFTLFLAAVILVPLTPLVVFGQIVIGGGESLITGGNGAATLGQLKPVKTIFAFHAIKPKGGVPDGRFECLALAPSAASGPESGQFTENIMYVAGVITGLEFLDKDTVQLRGQGRCTGIGAGEEVFFEATVRKGGPGTTIRLTVSTLPGVEFFEVVTSGSIEFFNKP